MVAGLIRKGVGVGILEGKLFTVAVWGEVIGWFIGGFRNITQEDTATTTITRTRIVQNIWWVL